ncbi:hypothetical protein F4780DRAFT_785873 [Xylariomycetidae sp. FL0641]|nr:hypothetical protein F4780DRAFT_785873 [Xylariomycetidae sp. FL0641]
MSAPYWGQLPTSKPRRMSQDPGQVDVGQSIDHHPFSQMPSRSNRTSAQTSDTDPPTDYTFSALTSPGRSSFPGDELASRPPTLPYGQNNYPPELLEKRRNRAGRAQENDFTQVAASTPPAAPDVPRAPPISYRIPQDDDYTYNAAGQPGPPLSAHRSSPQRRIASMGPESYYNEVAPRVETKRRAPSLVHDQRYPDGGAPSFRQVGRGFGQTASVRQPAGGQRREMLTEDPTLLKRQNTVGAESQRKMWADDRSPLQRLELTLDSITKEEKRARVEAAERRVRERGGRAGGNPIKSVDRNKPLPASPPVSQQDRFAARREPGGLAGQKLAILDDPIRAEPTVGAVPERSLPNKLAGESKPEPSPRSQIPASKSQSIPAADGSSIPKRNLSFRERAASNDIGPSKELSENDSPTIRAVHPQGNVTVTRSGSNKLKKNPPGDPWYNIRNEAEGRSAALNKTHGELPGAGFERPPARGKEADVYFDCRANEPVTVTDRPRGKGVPAAIGLGRSNSMGANRQPTHQPGAYEPPASDARGLNYDDYEDYEDSPTRGKGAGPAVGLNRANTLGPNYQPPNHYDEPPAPAVSTGTPKMVKFPDQQHEARMYDEDADGYGFRNFIHREKLKPGEGLYQPPTYLDEWKQATVGSLSGPLLDIGQSQPSNPLDRDPTWWESGSRRRGTSSSGPPRGEAFAGEYDDTKIPTRFKPALYLKCGPLLRYCGMRHEKPTARMPRGSLAPDKEIWRGSIMIVTQDSESSYDIAPMLRLFVQPIELLPPPPVELQGDEALLPAYVDPIAGIPKLGRRGETLYVRPIEHLEEGKDASMLDPDEGLFEITRTAPDFDNSDPAPPGSFTSRKRRIEVDGEKVGKYKDVRGFRLHTERGHTFWRFNIEVELREKQQRIAYRINRGPAIAFWVPARGESMNIMFHSCNGFSLSVNPDEFSGPDPMWRDVLNNHQTRPFHVMIGGGDQIYNDSIERETENFYDWLCMRNPLHKDHAPLTAETQDEMETFYLERYMTWFSQGLFGLANSQIPMVNMYDDHDIIDGFGSYPHHFMKSPVFSGLGNVAFKYYMLFQHQSLPTETEVAEPSWVLGVEKGPYINELSRSVFMHLGSKLALLAIDTRTERTREEIIHPDTWEKLKDRCYDEIVKGKTQHLLVVLGVPIAYPRLVWLENILTSRLMDPVKMLGRAGMLGNLLNKFDGGIEVRDDLDDHWTAKNHKEERRILVEDLQDLAADRSIRITILSGDVHLAAVGRFYSNPKMQLAKHKDFRYMPNIISSAIVNAPPPDLLADILNKRNKVHHFDKEADEDMVPIFTHGVDGKSRNNKHLLPHRNWCSIREYVPGRTPPPTPPTEEDFEQTPEGTPPGSRTSLLRRLSLSKNRGPAVRPDASSKEEVDRSRPPISSSGGFLRSLSRRGSDASSRPRKLVRSLSLGRSRSSSADPSKPRGLFRRNSSDQRRRPDDGGINGTWGNDSDEELHYPVMEPGYVYEPPRPPPPPPQHPGFVGGTDTVGLRGGGGGGDSAEFVAGDDAQFTATAAPPRRAATQPLPSHLHQYRGGGGGGGAVDFKRTPTGLLKKRRGELDVDLEGGLDICLNVEVNARDPAGITVPYRLLVPRLWYEYQGEDAAESVQGESGSFLGEAGEVRGYAGEEEEMGEEEDGGEQLGEDGGRRGGGGGGGGLKRWFSGRGSQRRAGGG